MTSLSVDDVTHLRSAVGDQMTSRHRLLYDVISNLDSMKETYQRAVVALTGKGMDKSRFVADPGLGRVFNRVWVSASFGRIVTIA